MFSVMSSPTTPSPRVEATRELAALVHQLHREAVVLGLADQRHRLAAELAGAAIVEAAHLRLVHQRVEAAHRSLVPHRAELLARRPSHALRRAVGRHQVGILRLDGEQLALELVELGVGDDRGRRGRSSGDRAARSPRAALGGASALPSSSSVYARRRRFSARFSWSGANVLSTSSFSTHPRRASPTAYSM